MMTDDTACLYNKLTYEPKGSHELKMKIHVWIKYVSYMDTLHNFHNDIHYNTNDKILIFWCKSWEFNAILVSYDK